MAEHTLISWADKSWSPWTGCTKVSPACDGCYAAHLMDTRMHRVEFGGPGKGEGTRDLMSDAYWREPLKWNRDAALSGVRPWTFPSLCDPFDKAVPAAWRRRFFDLIRATPHTVWLLLTKRAGLIGKLTVEAGGLPPNAAIGATFCNQEEWDRDSTKLAVAGAALDALFTFGSFEPLLGDIKFRGWAPGWIIAGGETDQGVHKARPTHPDSFRSLRDQAALAGVPFHFKQWGEWVSVSEVEGPQTAFHEFHDGATVRRVGKARSGRTIDGIIHDARPALRR